MGDTPTNPSHTARNAGIGVAVALLLYVLSVGPTAKLASQGKISQNFVGKFYAPIWRLIDPRPTVFNSIGYWYIGIWKQDLPPDEDPW
jgi:hypothetical protein